jgi:eukaryotic-like serine/threonine-protein kinase
MLDDKYRIERLLATGGMGAVYLGMHVGLRKRVAIKVLNPQLSSPPMIERFHREAITASQIGHEGIAQVTDLGTSGEGEPFLVMEYLEGESLASRLKATGPLAVEDACELGCAILAPLAAAHHAGIVHRDLKPDNVFLVRQSRGEMVKLLDFGISRMKGQDASFRLTTTGLVLGTPYYMSPEQARGDSEVTVGADLYSFGVMLYEMLIGVVPIRAENYNQLMYRVMTGEYTWPRRLRRDLPEALEQIIVRAMALEPADRPGSTQELEAALMPFCRQVFRDAATGRLSAPGLPFRSPAGQRGDARAPRTLDAGISEGIEPGGAPPGVARAPTLPPAAPARLPSRATSTTLTVASGALAADRAARQSWRIAAVVAVTVLVGIVGYLAVVRERGEPSARAVQSAAPTAVGRPTAPPPGQASPPVPIEPPPGQASPPAPVAPSPGQASPPASAEAGEAPSRAPLPGPPPPAASRSVHLVLDTRPQGATVLVAGTVVGTTPFAEDVPAGSSSRAYTLRKAGYEPATATLDTARDAAQQIDLKKQPAPRAAAPSLGDKGINPFDH